MFNQRAANDAACEATSGREQIDEKGIAGKDVHRGRAVEVDHAPRLGAGQGVTEIEMSERQFWNFAGLQPLAEKPWVTFMGRQVRVPNMPEDAQKCPGFRPAGAASSRAFPACTESEFVMPGCPGHPILGATQCAGIGWPGQARA